MKKLHALLLAVVVAVMFVMPTVAAPSPQAAVVTAGESIQTTVAGTTFKTPATDVANEVINVTSNAQVLQDLGVNSSAKLSAVIEVSYDGEIPAGGVQIPFVVNSAKAGDYVYVLHRSSIAPYQWSVVGQTVLGSDLTVVGTFTDFSPVAFMVVDASTVATTSILAPKTGEF